MTKNQKSTDKNKERPGLIPVRLGLTPEEHHSLRVAAAHANVSMTDFVKSVLLPVIMGKEHRAGGRRKRPNSAGQGGPTPGQGGLDES